MALWGDEFCEKFKHLRKGDLVAIKGAKVSDFGGHSLNAASDHAQLFTDLTENTTFNRLSEWWRLFQIKNDDDKDQFLSQMNSLTQKREPRESNNFENRS